ncbi:MAG: GGDEF domain-containing protein [Janthinobacterium lividum]
MKRDVSEAELARHSPETTSSEPHIGGAERHVFRLAAQTWLALQAIDVPPSPKNFELWFNYLGGGNAELTRRMEELLQHGHRPVPEVLELIHAECVAGQSDTDFEAIEDGAEVMEQVARETATHIAAGQRYLKDYNSVLSSVGVQLGRDQTLGSLVNTIATLVSETTRATELNRSLEARLNASAAQVQRLRQSLNDVKQDATTDSLTGLINRRGFDARLRRAMSRQKLDNTPICLLIADVDRFKSFNDTYGHKTGDLVLRLVGRLLADNVKGKDTAARFGGEEFALILSGADEQAGGKVAEQIRAALDGKRLINRGNGQHLAGVTISIGVAELRLNERSASLIERADAALYQAKNSGRNKVCLSTQTRAQ